MKPKEHNAESGDAGDTVNALCSSASTLSREGGLCVRLKLETVTDLPRAIGAILMRIAAELTPEEGSAGCVMC